MQVQKEHQNHRRQAAAVTLGLVSLMLLCTGLPSSARGFAQRHPRRAEVLHRDNNERGRINADKGHLDGHYNQLKREDNSIHRQERRDAKINGGYITKGQQQHLNKEENRLNRQIRHDQ